MGEERYDESDLTGGQTDQPQADQDVTPNAGDDSTAHAEAATHGPTEGLDPEVGKGWGADGSQDGTATDDK